MFKLSLSLGLRHLEQYRRAYAFHRWLIAEENYRFEEEIGTPAAQLEQLRFWIEGWRRLFEKLERLMGKR